MRKVRVSGYGKRDGTKVKSYTRRTYDPKYRNKTPYLYEDYLIEKSQRQKKQLKATSASGKVVHFGDPSMREFPGTKREDNFCARSYGIKSKKGMTRNNPASPNYFNRRITWKCKGKKGVSQ